jgi:hypothetical protein
MLGKVLSLDLYQRGIAQISIHPGFLKTGTTAPPEFVAVSQSATNLY